MSTPPPNIKPQIPPTEQVGPRRPPIANPLPNQSPIPQIPKKVISPTTQGTKPAIPNSKPLQPSPTRKLSSPPATKPVAPPRSVTPPERSEVSPLKKTPAVPPQSSKPITPELLARRMTENATQLVGELNLFSWFDDKWDELDETERNNCIKEIAEILR